MKLSVIREKLEKAGLLIGSTGIFEDKEIKGITFDSREVGEDYLFYCKGEAFEPKYLYDAVKKGAVCYVSEVAYDDVNAIGLIVSNVREAMSNTASLFYDYPSKKLHIASFTGTKGKTTCTHLMKQVMDAYVNSEYNHGSKTLAGLISTIESFDGVDTVESFNTTPEALELQKILRKCVDHGVEYCALEISSQALRYYRTDEVELETAAFLNISRDHISPREHKDFEDYFTAKLKIFTQAKVCIVNQDCDHADEIEAFARKLAEEKGKKVVTFSMNNEAADYYIHDSRKVKGGTEFWLRHNDFDEKFFIRLSGWFNIYNSTSVIISAYEMGLPIVTIQAGLKDATVSGRMEIFESEDGNIVCVADYAHNKISYESLFRALEEDYPVHSKNIKIIFGSVGDKAQERRAELGTVAGQRAKFCYISADYPGHEPFQKIADEIAYYVRLQNCPYTIIENRNVAIEDAISKAEGPTIIMACGFGRLTWQKYGDTYYPRESDVDCMLRCLKDYNEKVRNKEQ